MNRRISLNGSDWLFKDFYGEDWRWRDSHLPKSRGWKSQPGKRSLSPWIYNLSKGRPGHACDQGEEALRDEILRMRTQCQYLILDVTDQSALATIARAVYDVSSI
jgi:hypothetical protein